MSTIAAQKEAIYKVTFVVHAPSLLACIVTGCYAGYLLLFILFEVN